MGGRFLVFLIWIVTSTISAYAEIISEHPRLFFRTDPWGNHGLTVEMVRARMQVEGAEAILKQLKDSLPNLALRGLILGDENAVARALDELVKPLDFEDMTTDEGVIIAWRSIAFDWLYHHPLFTEEKKTVAAAQIVKGADILVKALEGGGHIFHTRMYGWSTGIALAGLALDGFHEDGKRFADYGHAYYRDRLFPARQLQNGSVHNGFGYGRKYTMWLTGHFLSCWYSATGEDLWQDVQEQQGDWARNEMLFCIYGRYPDHSYLRLADAYSIQSDHYSFRAVSERAWAYQDAVGFGFLKFLIEANRDRPLDASAGEEYVSGVLDWGSGYYYFLFYDPDSPSESHTALPRKKLFSPEGTGMVIWKSGWGEGDTTIFFKCGNYFGDHGHFDQGHLDIYRRKPLLIDSGSYLTFRGPFRMEYWRKTVAHNSILLVDPAITSDEGGQRVFHSQSDATIEEYQENQEAETGNILDYRVEAGLAYVAGDITAAYPGERALRVTRELTLLDDRHLVVLDRVILSRKGFDPRVIWHCPIKPEINSKKQGFVVAREGARASVRVLLPANPRISWIEGFRVGEQVYDAANHRRALADQGVGRVEVSDSDPGSEQFVFLHVIDIADDSKSEESVSASMNNSTIKVLVGQRELFFRRDDWGLVRWNE